MADLALRLGALTLLVEHLLFAAIVTAVVIAFTLTALLEALEAYFLLLGTLELGTWTDGIIRTLVAATIFSVFVHATGLASWEAICAFAVILAETIATISVTLALLCRKRALLADFVVRVACMGATLPERATEIRTFFSSGNALVCWCKWILCGNKGHSRDAGNNTLHLKINYYLKIKRSI